jgi:NADPH:quinone reductase-like Zn-dependent oxidoreductase
MHELKNSYRQPKSRAGLSSLMALTLVLGVTCWESTVADDAHMSAVRIHQFGGPEVLEVERIPQPSPGAGELLVRIHAAGVNPVDTQIREDGIPGLADAVVPYVPGFDLSGVVVAVGDGVSRFAPGDEIFAMLDLRRGGAYAEYALVKEGEAAARPMRVSHAEAASLPLVALTAWQALFETADLQPGQTVLIHAGAGGVGTAAIQLAAWRGARVITTASEENHDFVRALGADVAIDYRSQRFEDFAIGVDVVLDPIGGETQLRSLGTLREGGILVGLVGLTQAARSPVRDLRATAMLVRPQAGQLARIAELVDAGMLKPVLSHRFPLAEAAAAHRQSETRRTRGKIVLEILPDDAGAIRRTALDYIEGWYTGDAARMAQALHPALAKRIVLHREGTGMLEEMDAAELIASTEEGGGRDTPAAKRRAEVSILDVFGGVASVRVDAGEWIDYLHLAHWEGEWKIVNVLWAMR